MISHHDSVPLRPLNSTSSSYTGTSRELEFLIIDTQISKSDRMRSYHWNLYAGAYACG